MQSSTAKTPTGNATSTTVPRRKGSSSSRTRSAPAPPKPKPTLTEHSQAAFAKITKALSIDMPLIMHGSGDERQTNPESVQLLSELTANYIANLVSAAVDAHQVLNDGPRPLPPPPPFDRLWKIAKPAPYEPEQRTVPIPPIKKKSSSKSKKSSTTTAEDYQPAKLPRKRRRVTDE